MYLNPYHISSTYSFPSYMFSIDNIMNNLSKIQIAARWHLGEVKTKMVLEYVIEELGVYLPTARL